MRTIFIPLSKAYGLYVAYTGATYTLSMLPFISAILSPTDDEFTTQTMASIFGTNFVVTGISFTTVLLITIIAAWILIMKAEWLADKLGIPQVDSTNPANANLMLFAGIKLVGLYVIIQGIPAFVQVLFYVRHSPVFGIYVLSSIVPPLVRIGIGLLLVWKTSFIYNTLNGNARSAEPSAGGYR